MGYQFFGVFLYELLLFSAGRGQYFYPGSFLPQKCRDVRHTGYDNPGGLKQFTGQQKLSDSEIAATRDPR